MQIVKLLVLYACCSGVVGAATANDESALRSLYQCAQNYKDGADQAYDADVKKLEHLTDLVHSELASKYSKRDLDLMASLTK